jgi:hypothetical protein
VHIANDPRAFDHVKAKLQQRLSIPSPASHPPAQHQEMHPEKSDSFGQPAKDGDSLDPLVPGRGGKITVKNKEWASYV